MLKITRATEEDAKSIQQITVKAFTVYKDNTNTANIYLSALSESIEDIIKDIHIKTVFIATVNGQIAGSIRLEYLTKELAYISRFAVDPEEHNRGVGANLLQKAIDDCMEHGIVKVALHTNSKYYKLARYYYGKDFYVHSTAFDRGYIRALFIKDLVENKEVDIEMVLNK